MKQDELKKDLEVELEVEELEDKIAPHVWPENDLFRFGPWN